MVSDAIEVATMDFLQPLRSHLWMNLLHLRFLLPRLTSLRSLLNLPPQINYLLWKAQVVLVLSGHGLLGYVNNEVPCPPATTIGEDGMVHVNPEAAHWLGTDHLILDWLNCSLYDVPLSQVINSESSHPMMLGMFLNPYMEALHVTVFSRWKVSSRRSLKEVLRWNTISIKPRRWLSTSWCREAHRRWWLHCVFSLWLRSGIWPHCCSSQCPRHFSLCWRCYQQVMRLWATTRHYPKQVSCCCSLYESPWFFYRIWWRLKWTYSWVSTMFQWLSLLLWNWPD